MLVAESRSYPYKDMCEYNTPNYLSTHNPKVIMNILLSPFSVVLMFVRVCFILL